MASYKGVVVSPSLTQTAGGKNLYVPSAAGNGPEVILGDVDITGDLEVDGGAVSIVQTDRVTPSSAATLSLSGGLGAGGAAGGSVYTFYKGCGPLGSGVIYQDHLQLFRFGPTGAVQPTLSQVLDIAPKMVADSSPAQNLMSVFSDVNVGGDVLVAGKLQGPSGILNVPSVMRLGPVGTDAAQSQLPAPPTGLSVGCEVAPVTKVWTIPAGSGLVGITFNDLNAWINDTKPHKFFISVVSTDAASATPANRFFGSFDYYSFGSSVPLITSAPVTLNYVGDAGVVATVPALGVGPYVLNFGYGGSANANTIYITIKVVA